MIWGYARGRPQAASRRFQALLMVAATALAAAGCRKAAVTAPEISVSAQIAPQPVRAGTETLSIQLTGPGQRPVTGAHVQVEADMNHPGMAPVFADAVETAPGSYQARLRFTMGGDWVVLFHVTLSDGRKAERQMDVKGVESN